MADSLSSTFTGRVLAVNPKGLRLDGHDDWFHYSKYAVGIVEPTPGATVSVSVDRRGFIRAVEVLDGSLAAPTNGHAAPGAPSTGAQKDRTITRLAVLKAAAEFGASRPELRSRDVLAIADVWERWVLAPDHTDDELEAAF